LPDNGVVQRTAIFTVEDHDGLPLIGNAQPDEAGNLAAIPLGDFLDDGQNIFPDLVGVVFDPPGFGIDLAMIAGSPIQHLSFRAEEDSFCGGGALVDGKDHSQRSKRTSANDE
jgi:hypothetical protein